MAEVDQPDLTLFGRFDQDRTGAIAENDAGRAVGIVDDRRHGVRTDDQNLGVDPGLDQLGSHLKRVKKTGASCGKVEAPRTVGAELVLNQAGGGGEQHVGSYGGDDHHLHLVGLDPPLGKAAARCFDRHITGRHAGFHQVALANAQTLHDPLIGGVYHFCQIGIIEDARRHIGSQSADFGAAWCTRTQFDAQYTSPLFGIREGKPVADEPQMEEGWRSWKDHGWSSVPGNLLRTH